MYIRTANFLENIHVSSDNSMVFKRHAVIGNNWIKFTRRTAISIQLQSWDMLLTSYSYLQLVIRDLL